MVQKVRSLPSEVVVLRYADLQSHDAIEGRPETVLCYTKEIEISSSALEAVFEGAAGITDVFRLSVNPMLSRMEDPWENYHYVHPRTGEVQQARCARLYHLNIVLCIQGEGGHQSISRVRAVLNKKGVLRVESVEELDSTDRLGLALNVGTEEMPTVFIGDEQNA